jgi:hypothetical protein
LFWLVLVVGGIALVAYESRLEMARIMLADFGRGKWSWAIESA